AAFVVWNSHHTIDVGVLFAVIESVFCDNRDLLRFVAGAHTGRYNQDKVTSSDATVGTAEPLEARAFVVGNVIGRWCIQVNRQIANDWNLIRHVLLGNGRA